MQIKANMFHLITHQEFIHHCVYKITVVRLIGEYSCTGFTYRCLPSIIAGIPRVKCVSFYFVFKPLLNPHAASGIANAGDPYCVPPGQPFKSVSLYI